MYSQGYLNKSGVSEILGILMNSDYPNIAHTMEVLYANIERTCNQFIITETLEGVNYEITVIGAKPLLEKHGDGIIVGANVFLGVSSTKVSEKRKLAQLTIAIDKFGYTEHEAFIYKNADPLVFRDDQLPFVVSWIRHAKWEFQRLVNTIEKSGKRVVKRQHSEPAIAQKPVVDERQSQEISTETNSAVAMPASPIPHDNIPRTPQQIPQPHQQINQQNTGESPAPKEDVFSQITNSEKIPPINLESTSNSATITIPDDLFKKKKK